MISVAEEKALLVGRKGLKKSNEKNIKRQNKTVISFSCLQAISSEMT